MVITRTKEIARRRRKDSKKRRRMETQGFLSRIRSLLPGTTSSLELSAPSSDRAPSYPDAALGRGNRLKVCELFSPPRLTAHVRREGVHSTTEPSNFDRQVGWEFNDPTHRREFLEGVGGATTRCGGNVARLLIFQSAS